DHACRDAGAYFLDWLHARRPALPAVLHLSRVVLLQHAGPGHRRNAAAAVHLLGTRRPVLLSANRILVREEKREQRGHQGVHHQSRWRFWIPHRLWDSLLSPRQRDAAEDVDA